MAEVLPAPVTREEQSSFEPPSPLRRSSSQPSLYLDTSDSSLKRGHSSTPTLNASSALSSDTSPSSLADSPPESPIETRIDLSRTPSFHSTPPSSVSLDMQYAHAIAEGDDDDDEDLQLPMFGDSSYKRMPSSAPPGSPNDRDNFRSADDEDDEEDDDSSLTQETDPDALMAAPADDTQVKQEPSRQVDYLSHEWREEDIWESWKHIVSRRRFYGERSRLENASWRTWAKQKNNLKTVSPETLNWLKDCDVTWLYGPLQESKQSRQTSEPPSRLSKSSSFINKKPILKKRSVSEEMLQKSLSSSSLIKQAAAAVQAQRKSSTKSRSVPGTGLRRSVSEVADCSMLADPTSYKLTSTRTMSSSTESGLDSPDNGQSGRHIRFDNKVEQCIAVDFKDFTIDEENHPEWARAVDDTDSDDDDDDRMPTIKTKVRKRSVAHTPISSRNSFSEANPGIAKLPATTLKHEEVPSHFSGLAHSRRPMLSPSPSQETIRPAPRRTPDFALPTDSDDDLDWEPSGAFGSLRRDSLATPKADKTQERLAEDAAEEGLAAKGMRRTPSGMFMPLDESEDEDAQSTAGILGRVVDTVNTARDIAYVLYNVGWRR